jgi:hypothetical protein
VRKEEKEISFFFSFLTDEKKSRHFITIENE